MQPLPDKNTILSAVAAFLAGASKKDNDPGLKFKLKLAAGLVAMVERELRLEAEHGQAENERLSAHLGVGGELAELNRILVEKIKKEPLDWPATLKLVQENLKAELAVIQPKFEL